MGEAGWTGCMEERSAGRDLREDGPLRGRMPSRRARFLSHLPPLLISLWMWRDIASQVSVECNRKMKESRPDCICLPHTICPHPPCG